MVKLWGIDSHNGTYHASENEHPSILNASDTLVDHKPTDEQDSEHAGGQPNMATDIPNLNFGLASITVISRRRTAIQARYSFRRAIPIFIDKNGRALHLTNTHTLLQNLSLTCWEHDAMVRRLLPHSSQPLLAWGPSVFNYYRNASRIYPKRYPHLKKIFTNGISLARIWFWPLRLQCCRAPRHTELPVCLVR